MPPPVAPPDLPSFQTTSLVILEPLASSFVPPQQSTCGLDPGKSTLLPLAPSLDPSSPAATVMVMPSAAADLQALSMEVIEDLVQPDSGPPQLMEMTEGALPMSWTALVMASRKPLAVLVVKYTTMFAPGATAPATSISRATSPSALL